MRTPHGELNLHTRLPGRYNARNVAAVAALSDLFEIDRTVLAATLARDANLPGRFEHLELGQPYDLILDFAPSPAALDNFLSAVGAAMHPSGRLRVVLGVLGSPGTAQCRAMGRVARALCDQLVLTSGSYRADPPVQSLEGLLSGARGPGRRADVEIVPRRRDAIATALRAARSQDVLAILGRGAVREAVSDRHVSDKSVLHELARAARAAWR